MELSTSITDQWHYSCGSRLTSSCKGSMEACISSGATLLRPDKHGSCSYRKREGEREKGEGERDMEEEEGGIEKGEMGGAERMKERG